jgi:hypothetical protein
MLCTNPTAWRTMHSHRRSPATLGFKRTVFDSELEWRARNGEEVTNGGSAEGPAGKALPDPVNTGPTVSPWWNKLWEDDSAHLIKSSVRVVISAVPA